VTLGWLIAMPLRRWLERLREADSAPVRGD